MMKHQHDERTFKDPVCGMLVSRLTAVADAEYERKTYYFCARECRDAFVADPDKYIHAHRQHGLRPNKATSGRDS